MGVLIAVFAVGSSLADLSGVAAAALYVFTFLVVFGYPAALETLWRGRTLGKAAFGLRVVTVEGAPVRFRHAAIRSIVQLVDKLLFGGVIGVLTLLASPRNQRLGDLLAGTIVVRERTGARQPTAVRFTAPPHLTALVSTLDTSGLTDADYTTVRSFLLRTPSLSPEVRWTLARQLADPLVARMRTTVPSGLTPDDFLLAVAVAFQARSAHVTPAAARPVFESVWAALDS